MCAFSDRTLQEGMSLVRKVRHRSSLRKGAKAAELVPVSIVVENRMITGKVRHR